MTNEQAIKWLKDYIQNTPFQMEQYERAFDMAIQALSQEPCDNAISRQAVINAIENDCMKGGLGSCFACYNDAQAFRGEIEKLPSVTQKSGKWIPASKRLPEKGGEYLITWTGVCGKQRSKPLIGIAEYEIYEPENYEDWITTDNEFRHYHDIKVLAWQELPKPYEPQESEEQTDAT